MPSGIWYAVIQLYWNNGCQYADGTSGDQDEFLEKKKKPYHGVLYLYGVQYGRLPDTDRRPAASDGIYARSTILLESASFPGIAQGRKPDISKPGTEFHIDGLHNIVFLIMIVAAVILSGVLPGLPAFQNAEGAVKGIRILGEVTLTFPALIEVIMILLAAFLSFKTTDKSIRRRNHFTWGAIKEVAVLFIGIFITMQPALMLLKALGPKIGLYKPMEMFWATGALSSFLDNTPTYLVFLTTAGTLGFMNGVTTSLGTIPVKLLSAISSGAVFMGANTYIGNAPNFMVKAISDENGVNMPSFFGYILWSLVFLIPVFILDMLVFFM